MQSIFSSDIFITTIANHFCLWVLLFCPKGCFRISAVDFFEACKRSMAAFWPDRSTHTGMRLNGGWTPDGKEAFSDFWGVGPPKNHLQVILTSYGIEVLLFHFLGDWFEIYFPWWCCTLSMVWVCWALLGFPIPGEDVKVNPKVWRNKKKQRLHHHKKRYAKISAIIYVSHAFQIVLLCVMTTTMTFLHFWFYQNLHCDNLPVSKMKHLVRRHFRDWTNMNYIPRSSNSYDCPPETMKKQGPKAD